MLLSDHLGLQELPVLEEITTDVYNRGNRPQNQGQRKFTPRYQAQQNNFKNHYIDRSNYSRKSYLNAEYDDKNWEEYDNARDCHYYD